LERDRPEQPLSETGPQRLGSQSRLDGPDAPQSPDRSDRRKRVIRTVQVALSVVVVVAIFALILPKIASYTSVWRTIAGLTWLELLTVILAATFNLFTYWWQMMSALPRLTLWQAAVNNQTTTTISNILPGGGVVALGMTYAMLHSWGYTGSEIALMISTTGIWNSFMKLGLPVIALAILAITGQATTALLIPAVVGLAILAGSLLLFALMLWRKQLARSIGDGIGKMWSRIRGLLRKPPVTEWGERAVRFRKQTIKLVAKRWIPLTATTVVSHLALWFVLMLALRHVGVAEHEISWAQILAVFAFARLLSAAPITPGGVGLVELALIAGLYAAGKNQTDAPLELFRAQIAAAVLLYRTLTYGLQIPLGGFTYLIWQRKKSWRKAPPPEEAAPVSVKAPAP
jgi:putative heme transporter